MGVEKTLNGRETPAFQDRKEEKKDLEVCGKRNKTGREGCQQGKSAGTKNSELLSRKWPMAWEEERGTFLREIPAGRVRN